MSCRVHHEVSIRLAEILLKQANSARPECDHDNCLILDGVMRDSALKIRRLAQELIKENEPGEIEAPFASAREGGRR